jgi:hypothetical protein
VGYVELPGSTYFNTGHGRTFHEVPWNDSKGTVYGLAFADFDGDGWPDIVAARSGAPMASGLARNRPRANALQPQKTAASRTTCFHPRRSRWRQASSITDCPGKSALRQKSVSGGSHKKHVRYAFGGTDHGET